MPRIEARRAEMLEAVKRDGMASNIRALLDCLFRPQLELIDEEGRHRYAAFLRQVLMSNEALDLRNSTMEHTPVSQEIVSLIYEAMPPMPEFFLRRRLINANLIYADYLVRFDHERTASPDFSITAEIFYEEALSVVTAAMRAEPPQQ